jgi:hypothetical protein
MIGMVGFLLIKEMLLKTFNETLTPWTDTNCVQVSSTNFSPINVDTQKLQCNQDIFVDLLFDQSNKYNQVSFYNGEDPNQFNFTLQEGFLTLFLSEK